MTLPQLGLHPVSGDDRRALLSTLEFVAGGRFQFAEVGLGKAGTGHSCASPRRWPRLDSS